jgi:membrane protein
LTNEEVVAVESAGNEPSDVRADGDEAHPLLPPDQYCQASHLSMNAAASDRGRAADRPQEIPPRGWWDVSWRVMKRLGSDNISLVSGGIAMYALLSIFPGLAVLVSIYGLFATPADVVRHMSAFSGVLPPGVWDIFKTQLQSIAGHGPSTLSTAAAIGFVLALWSARSAMSALMSAANIAYGEREKRNFFVQVLVSLVLTLGAVLGFLLMVALGIAIPVALKVLGTRTWVQWTVDVVQWAILWLFSVGGLAFVYRFAPAREPARWRWVTWGSAIAATLWIGMSLLFAFYVRTFADYGKTYGALGGVIALLMWFYLSSLVVVLGAEINAEMERQTAQDTTTGPKEPLGERGAYAADTVGPSAGARKPNPADREPAHHQIEGR